VETYKLYGGKIILQYDDAKHIYKVNDKIVYGVTNIVSVLSKPALIYWAVNQAIDYIDLNLEVGKSIDELQKKQLLEEARVAHKKTTNHSADAGTLIHEWIEKYVKAKIEKKPVPKRPVSKEMKSAVDGFFKWAKEHKVKLIKSEQKIYSRKYKYAGTLDLEAEVDGKKTIIDFKTGKAIYPEMFLQAAAYLQAKEEENGRYDGGVAIVRLSQKQKDITPFEVKSVSRQNVDKLIKVFLSCLNIYRWKMELKKEAILNK